MADAKGKKGKKKSDEKHSETRQIVVTLHASNGGVIKVESLDEDGERTEVSEKEFAVLAGEDELDYLETALEEAYAAGVGDAIDESVGADDEDEEYENSILREVAARELLRSGVRRLIWRRALKRDPKAKPSQARRQSNHNGAEESTEA